MHSTVIIFNVFVSLVSYVHGDLVMQSQTYNFNATASDNKGKMVPVSGTMLNVQVVYMEIDNGKGAGDDVKFSIWANAPGSKSGILMLPSSQQDNSDYSESMPTALFDSFLPSGQKNGPPLIGIPSQIFQIPPAPSQNFQSFPQSTSNSKQSSSQSAATPQSTNVHNTNFSPGPLPAPLNNIVSKGAPFSGSTGHFNASSTSASLPSPPNNTPMPSLPMNNTYSKFTPLPSPPSTAPLQPSSMNNNNANSKFTPLPSPPNNTPLQPQPINNNTSSHFASLPSPPNNASLPGNSNAPGVVGNKNTRTKRSVDGHTNHSTMTNGTTRTYTVQNVTLWPSNSTATIKLYPIAGYQWIKNTSGLANDERTQTWLNPHNLNLRAPIRNISVSMSPGNSIDDESGVLSVENTDSNAKPNRSYYNTLQDLQIAAMKNATDRLSSVVQGYFNNSAAQTDLSSLQNIVDNDLEQLVDGLVGGTGDTMTSTPTTMEVYVLGTDIPKNISNTWYNVTTNNQPSQLTNGTGGGGNSTTESSTTGSWTTGSPTTGSPNTVGSGNMVISSWMTIFLSSLIALLSTIIVV